MPQLIGIEFKPSDSIRSTVSPGRRGHTALGRLFTTLELPQSIRKWEGHSSGPKTGWDNRRGNSAAPAWDPETTDFDESLLHPTAKMLYFSQSDLPC